MCCIFLPEVAGHSAVRRSLARLTLDVLNQVSLLAVVAACVATSMVGLAHLNRQFKVVAWEPALAFARPGSAAEFAARQEAGLAAPSQGTLGPGLPNPNGPLPNPSAVYSAAPITPTADFASRGALRSGTWIPILMYHYIRQPPLHDRVGDELSVAPDVFERQMRYLSQNGYDTLTMREVDLILAGRMAMPPKPVALTFDDGYADFYTTAAPILRNLEINATNYVPTGLVGRDGYMSWSDIQELDAQGFEMGAHTEMHVDLSKMTPDRVRVEVYGSKLDLEQHLGHPVLDFAYPYGGFNHTAVEMVREAGFWSATTTIGGAYHDERQLLVLSRVRVNGSETFLDWERSLGPPPSRVSPVGEARSRP